MQKYKRVLPKIICPPPGSLQAIHLLAASEDGKWLASANSDHEVHIYNLQTRKVCYMTTVFV